MSSDEVLYVSHSSGTILANYEEVGARSIMIDRISSTIALEIICRTFNTTLCCSVF